MGGLDNLLEETKTNEANRKEIKNNEEDLHVLLLTLTIFGLLIG
jgi:hypothetical protein